MKIIWHQKYIKGNLQKKKTKNNKIKTSLVVVVAKSKEQSLSKSKPI